MTDTVHKGQKQVVEGSAVGDYHVIPKFAYNSFQQVEYIGEAKVGVADSVNRHYIQKMIYDCVGNLERILIAVNIATAGCTEVSVVPISDYKVKIIAHNGDFAEVEYPHRVGSVQKKPSELTGFRLNTGTQVIEGRIIEINDDATEIIVERNIDNPVIVVENNTIINESDLLLTFNSDNKPYEKRRWTNRTRYIYETKA